MPTLSSKVGIIVGEGPFLEITLSALRIRQISSEYAKVPNVPGLYRNTSNGTYHGCKKVEGRRKERSLGTTDRKIAERRLKEWIANLGKVDSSVEKTTLKQLCERFVAINQERRTAPCALPRPSSKSSRTGGLTALIVAPEPRHFVRGRCGIPQPDWSRYRHARIR